MYETCASFIGVRAEVVHDFRFFFRILHGPHAGRQVTLSLRNYERRIPEPRFHGTINRILVQDHTGKFWRVKDFNDCIDRVYCIRYAVSSDDEPETTDLDAHDVLFRYATNYDFSNTDFW